MLYPLIVCKWQMLLPYDVVEDVTLHNSVLQHIIFADVIAKWQMEYPLQRVAEYQLVDVITRWQMDWPQGQSSFNFSSEVLSGTSSHMCGRWYLPMFLFRDGLLTLMNNASFILLLRFWSSPHYAKIFQNDIVTSDVKMVIYWGGVP